jgi:outer membrane protein assembly factor BamB
MLTMDILAMNDHVQYIPLIIPTVLIPFTLLSVGVSVVATFIAGLFGVELKAEGPKQLLEVLLRPRVLVVAVVSNIVFYFGYQGYEYVKNLPSFEMTIKRKQAEAPAPLPAYDDNISRINKMKVNVDRASLDKFDIKQDWTLKLGMGSFRNATEVNGHLFFGTFDGHIYEVSPKERKVFRKIYVGTIIGPAPVIYKGKLYSGEGSHHTHHARILKYDLKTGLLEKTYTTLGHTEGQPVIATHNGKTLMFAVAGKDGIHAIDPETMEAVWKVNPGHIDAAVRVENGVVYAGTGREKGDAKKYQTYVAAYDFDTGKEIWKNEIPMSSWMEPALTDKYACFIMGEIYFPSKMGGLACFNKKTGSHEFVVSNDSPLIGVPLVVNNDVFISDLDGEICRISTEKRRSLWCTQTKVDGKQMTAVKLDTKRNLIVYTTTKNGVYFLSPVDGKIIKHHLPSKEETEWSKTYASANILEDGIITVDKKGVLRKLNYVEM